MNSNDGQTPVECVSVYEEANNLANKYPMSFRMASILVHIFNFGRVCNSHGHLALLRGIRNLIDSEITDFCKITGLIDAPGGTTGGPIPVQTANPPTPQFVILTQKQDPEAFKAVDEKLATQLDKDMQLPDGEWRERERDEKIGINDEVYDHKDHKWIPVDEDWPGKPVKLYPARIRTRDQKQ